MEIRRAIPPLSAETMSAEERREAYPLPAGLITVWVNQATTGYGIYFKNLPSGEGMIVSKIDPNSEANKSGVQVGDHLVIVNDQDIRFQPYQDTLELVRKLQSCKMTFIPGTAF
ncbi:hypothetical protein T492DRAFT_979868 [Pavlovales sp. CCMP2436]|nr:hypothetical protein T492DRAFT_979868 [Pavlovales sp. CCMP2436]|mmetsp:Transcript_12981/g.32960  ORF Transcript_12981/g.32960 Transcript_12981/m.32960 type:complete len:114 (-) Transcript_12981:244-585(-)